MYKNLIVLMVVFSMAATGFVLPAFGQSKDAKRAAERAEKIRQEVKALGTGEKIKVRVDLFGEKIHRGYISESNDKNFTVVDKKGVPTTIDYVNVKDITKKGRESALVTGIVVGAAAGVVLGLWAFLRMAGG